jgi:hypothetical protein
MREHLIAGNSAIGSSTGKSKTGGGGSKSLKLEMVEIQSGSYIPRIRKEKAS